MSPRPLALVAGVGDGLGKAAARRFARAGHLVVLVARKEERLQRIADEIAAEGGEAVVKPADLRFDDQIHALFEDVAALGRRGIHVCHVIVDGVIDMPAIHERFPELVARLPEGGMLDTDAIAETYYALHCQDRSAWTLEIDVRPWCEEF